MIKCDTIENALMWLAGWNAAHGMRDAEEKK